MERSQKLTKDLKSCLSSGNLEGATKAFNDLKKIMIDLDSLPPICAETPSAADERALFRQVLEYGVLLSVAVQDRSAFQRNISSLRPFYTQFGYDVTPGSVAPVIIGLNLLYLLVENRLADFHCEIELLSKEVQELPAITFCTQLEQRVVVGAYDMVLAAAANPPVPQFSFFLNSLLETVRLNIGECVAASYTSMKISSATKILMFSNDGDTKQFIQDNYADWKIEGETIVLGGNKVVKSEEIQSMKLIAQTLSYATELERIV